MKMAQRQSLVSIEGIPGLWANKTGGSISADVSKVWDGGADTPEMLPGPPSAENVTTTRPFDDQRDLPEMARLRRLVGRFTTTVTEQPTNGDLFPVGPPTVYPNALMVKLNEPDYDATSSESKVVSIEWAIAEYV